MYGPGTNLAHGASLFFHSEFQVHYAMDVHPRASSSPAPGRSRCARTPTTSTSSGTAGEIDQLVWSHPSIEHSHYKNPQGKVFTLSPWRLELYWEWTRSADPEQFVVG